MEPSRKRPALGGPSIKQEEGELDPVELMNEGAQALAQGAIQHALAQSSAGVQRTMDTVNSNLPKVVAALETLSQSAADTKRTADAASTSLPQIASTLEEVKQQLAAQGTAHEQTSATLAALKADVTQTKGTLGGIQSNTAHLKWQNTVQILQWAYDKSDQFSFTYYSGDSGYPLNSSSLIQPIIGAFMTRCGWYLPNEYHMGGALYGEPSEDQRREFRDELAEQIHQLTGQKPRFVRERNDSGVMQWVIWRE